MLSSLLNVCLQIVEALIAFYFYESISHITKEKIKRFSVIFISYLVMCAVNLAFDYNIFVNAIFMLIFHFVFALILYHQKTGKSVFYAFLFTCLVGYSDICVLDLIALITGGNSKAYIDNMLLYTMHIVLSKSILFFTIKIVSGIINRFSMNEKFDYEFYIYPIVLLIIVIVFIVISYQNNLNYKSSVIISISSILLILFIIITCILQQQSSRRKAELTELKAIQQKQEIESTYFDLLEHQNEELQIFVHDIQKHLENLYNISDSSEESKKYIKALSTDLLHSNKVGKTSNKLLDIIISKYDFICDKNHIQFEKNIHSSDLSFITDNDLTSIFNNLLDNAVESAQKSEKKKIILSINSFGNILTIELLDSCDTPPKLKNNSLVSSKTENGFHGYGFKSVMRSIKKYNGDIEWDYDEREKFFNVSILFPQ